MFIRNLQFDNTKHYKCNQKIAEYLINKGFAELGRSNDMVIFKNTQELQSAVKVMPLKLKFIAKLGGDSNE